MITIEMLMRIIKTAKVYVQNRQGLTIQVSRGFEEKIAPRALAPLIWGLISYQKAKLYQTMPTIIYITNYPTVTTQSVLAKLTS